MIYQSFNPSIVVFDIFRTPKYLSHNKLTDNIHKYLYHVTMFIDCQTNRVTAQKRLVVVYYYFKGKIQIKRAT